MGQRQQPDHGAAGALVAVARRAAPRRRAGRRAREQLVAIDQIEQRHRLAAQRMDDVPVVDDVAVLAVGTRPAARAASATASRAEEAFEPIVVEAHAQPMADQPRGHACRTPCAAMKPPVEVTVTTSPRSRWCGAAAAACSAGALELDALARCGRCAGRRSRRRSGDRHRGRRSRASRAAAARPRSPA